MNTENDKKEIGEFISSRIRAHIDANGEEVKFIQAGFDVNEDSASFCFYLETEGDGPNGEWTTSEEENFLMREHWTWDESKPENHSEVIEQLIKDTFFELRVSGAFETLPKTKKCDFGIESVCGCYGWPDWDDRGKENLLESV